MKLRPLAGYILIEPLDEQETTASGLVMPEKVKEKPAKGKVVSVGGPIPRYEAGVAETLLNGDLRLAEERCLVRKGDIVVFHRWAGQDVREGQKEYKLVKFQDIMGIYE